MGARHQHTAWVNGRSMTPDEIAAHIKKTTGQSISEDAVRVRLRRGIRGDDLIAPPRQISITVEIDGEEMDASTLADYILDTRGYEVHPNCLRKRMRQGKRGEELLAPSAGTSQARVVKQKSWGKEITKVDIAGWGFNTTGEQ